jgi:hypothetical protein
MVLFLTKPVFKVPDDNEVLTGYGYPVLHTSVVVIRRTG